MSNERRGRHGEGGFTLVEVIMAIVIVSVGIAGVLSVFNVNVRNSADPLVRKQLISIAEEMLEEISLRPYAAGPASPPGTGCVRSTFDDVSDYNAYPPNDQVCNVEGNAIPALAGYTMKVTVSDVSLDALAVAAPANTPAKRVQVVVSRGANTITLVAWRVEYAAP